MTGNAKRAWTQMFAQHGPVLRGFFVRRGANEDAEDMVQETYLRLLRAHQQQGEAIANPEAYLYTVALNLAREQAARRKQAPLRIEELEQFSQLLAAGDDVEDTAQRQQRQQRLQALLAGLPERTRAVLVMQYRDGLSYKQIAERMGVSAHMVKKHVVRGLSACRRALADSGDSW
ncbi:RNA polymerase subunit sigma-70 [Xanthomonas translucens pv. arrhenatheri]|nr:RNA polymerase sigma factor [Xanthomonas translucens]OAX64576.1 RNA polymerase subunit sigma-70 [Xanthomonas translucens pv. arrhenatheri]UKE61035.1 RNA polymerase sigma factor [Xanthomonas translucens pv. poae]UKE76530.1 RNA polymerase sigma factor [Xanthomonas translucens pv. arrhenatheri]